MFAIQLVVMHNYPLCGGTCYTLPISLLHLHYSSANHGLLYCYFLEICAFYLSDCKIFNGSNGGQRYLLRRIVFYIISDVCCQI